jgi:hypothetical protein
LPNLREYPVSVYVDPLFEAQPRTAQARRHGKKWCHMIADSTEELLAMATKIGLRHSWIQCAGMGRHREHFDVVPAKRAAAIRAGALELDRVTHLNFLAVHAPNLLQAASGQ